MAVTLFMGKRKKPRNGYRLHEYSGDGSGYQDEYSEDEDDVFVEDITPDGLAAMSKPLMHPRQRSKVKSRTPECKCRSLCKPVLYFLLLVTVLGALASILLYVLNKHKDPDQSKMTVLQENKVTASMPHELEELIGCDTVEVEDVWVVGFPKLLTESAFRLVDVNQDGVLDIIFGFASGADSIDVDELICKVYFNGSIPCNGGMMALEGLTGRELWRHYSEHELFALNCNADLDLDGVLDCVGGGRGAAFEAVSSKDGKLLWIFQDGEAKRRISNVYTAQYLDDLDDDHVPDLLVAHGGDPTARPHTKIHEPGRIMLMSGKTGQVLHWVNVPENKETYYSPQIYFQADGTQVVLFGTGGETHGGSLWAITLDHIKHGRMDQARAIYTDDQKGVMTPPLLVDLTGDGTLDIVINPYNSTVLAIDGRSYSLLWKHTFAQSESYSTPGGGYFNADDTPDFILTSSFGPGFPLYYHTETTILDGKTGQPIITAARASVGSQTSSLTISMEGRGHDLFLYWISDCLGHVGEGGMYRFIENTNVHEQSRADFCGIRYNSTLFSKMLAVSSAIKPPGTTVYISEKRKYEEHKDWVNTTQEGLEFVRKHPEYKYLQEQPEGGEKTERQLATPQKENYMHKPPSSEDNFDNFPSAKKMGSSLQSQRDELAPHLPQAQAAPASLYQQQQKQQRQRQVDKYNLNPYDSPSYRLPDLEDTFHRRKGAPREDSESQGSYGYPYNPDSQRPEYPGYYPRDSYPYPDSVYGDGYRSYRNYFQKRNQANMNSGLYQKDGVDSAGYADNMRSAGNIDSLGAASGNWKVDRKERKQALAAKGQSVKTESISREGKGQTDASLTAKNSATERLEPESYPNHKHKAMGGHSASGAAKESHAIEANRKVSIESGKSRNNAGGNSADDVTDSGKVRISGRSSTADGSSSHFNFMKRKRRHVGPHDNGGLQRLISTGTLAPPTLSKQHPDYAHSMDVVFATYWFYPAKTQAILPKDQECIDKMMENEAQRFDPNNKYYGLDHDLYGHMVTDECLEKNQRKPDNKKIYTNQGASDSFSLHMGQMTVYRLRLKCTCSQVTNSTVNQRCAKVLPFDQQHWPAYMGRYGDSHWH